jgi:hypothetical protein
VFEEVTNARAAMARASSPAEAGAADSLLGQALGRLFAVAVGVSRPEGVAETSSNCSRS